jgi:hypothetical protein
MSTPSSYPLPSVWYQAKCEQFRDLVILRSSDKPDEAAIGLPKVEEIDLAHMTAEEIWALAHKWVYTPFQKDTITTWLSNKGVVGYTPAWRDDSLLDKELIEFAEAHKLKRFISGEPKPVRSNSSKKPEVDPNIVKACKPGRIPDKYNCVGMTIEEAESYIEGMLDAGLDIRKFHSLYPTLPMFEDLILPDEPTEESNKPSNTGNKPTNKPNKPAKSKPELLEIPKKDVLSYVVSKIHGNPSEVYYSLIQPAFPEFNTINEFIEAAKKWKAEGQQPATPATPATPAVDTSTFFFSIAPTNSEE